MSDDIKISILKDEKKIPEIIELFETGLGATTKEFWQWRIFSDNGLDSPELAVAETDNGQIVGMASVLPALYGDKEYKCFQFCDWVVHPDFRGRGIVGNLYRFFCERYIKMGYDFMIEYPNDMSKPIFEKYQFDILPEIYTYESKKSLYIPALIRENESLGNFEFKITDKIPDDLVIKQKPDKIYRTQEFLHWKFDLNPSCRYKWLTIYNKGKACGYFVFTTQKGRFRTAVNVYDWDYDTTDSKPFEYAIKMLKRYGNYVSIWGQYGNEALNLFLVSGLKRTNHTTRQYLKSTSEKGYPEKLTLTRIDTDY